MKYALLAIAASFALSTAAQAARIAAKAGVGQLLLGHYSSRYDNETQFLIEAKEVFANTLLGQEGMTYLVE